MEPKTEKDLNSTLSAADKSTARVLSDLMSRPDIPANDRVMNTIGIMEAFKQLLDIAIAEKKPIEIIAESLVVEINEKVLDALDKMISMNKEMAKAGRLSTSVALPRDVLIEHDENLTAARQDAITLLAVLPKPSAPH